ncbi:MAG: UDP-N-acetylglucosamine--N-acetylmuramyl-(pentapeptide) pyrophosphoryl-undecaprenol N-acetylglucosamine transferase [Pseudomonadota bacterium]
MPEATLAKPLVIIGAGGTGGHMFPAAAFAEEMRARGWLVGLVSDVRGLRYTDKFPVDWKEEVEAASPNLKKPWTWPGTVLKLHKGRKRAAKLIQLHRPALVAGFGGYPAFPLLSAAKAKRVPILIHEQNAVLGRVNRQFAKHAALVASGFKRLDKLPPGTNHMPVGNPVRPAIAAKRDDPYPPTDGDLNIFITGGSQGARILGETLPHIFAEHVDAALRPRLRIVQQVREEQIDQVRAVYEAAGIPCELKPFFDDMPDRIAKAHFIMGRAGAGTVSEIAAIGRPAFYIPLAIAMDDHQSANSDVLIEAGGALGVDEDNLFPDMMGYSISRRLEDPEALEKMAAAAKAAGTITAASDLADLAERAAGR